MRIGRTLIALFGLSFPALADLMFNSPTVDSSLFRLTQFAAAPSAYSMQRLDDGSIAVLAGDSIQRFVDANNDGFADGAPTTIYQAPGGFLTGFTKVGDYYAVGDLVGSNITLLKPGATPADALTSVGSLHFDYATDWYHPTAGFTARATPGSPGSFDLVFNVGSQYNGQLSTDQVPISGLLTGAVDGDSIYKVTINQTGLTPVVSGLQKILTGIRNVAGMKFAANGDFYFADNAIDGPGADGDEPPQADELNRILAADFGASVPNFGYPDCYVEYRTGAFIGSGSGCLSPLVAFQPLNNGTLLGDESEGPAEFAFAPVNFPEGYNNGIFIGFSGKPWIGVTNEENAVVYYDFGTGQNIHFTPNSLPNVGHPIGLLATNDQLFISDLGTGIIYQIAVAVPEASTLSLIIAGLTLAGILRRRTR